MPAGRINEEAVGVFLTQTGGVVLRGGAVLMPMGTRPAVPTGFLTMPMTRCMVMPWAALIRFRFEIGRIWLEALSRGARQFLF